MGNRPTLAQHMAEGMRLKRIPASKIMGCPFSADNCDSECSECVEQFAILLQLYHKSRLFAIDSDVFLKKYE